MAAKRHSRDRIIDNLREADTVLATGKTIAEVCWKLEIGASRLAVVGGPDTANTKTKEAKRPSRLEEAS